jgi:hypothetical protein
MALSLTANTRHVLPRGQGNQTARVQVGHEVQSDASLRSGSNASGASFNKDGPCQLFAAGEASSSMRDVANWSCVTTRMLVLRRDQHSMTGKQRITVWL